MFELLQRWLGRHGAPDHGPAVEAWARERGWVFKPTREHDGFVIEGPSGGWRLEWGPAQRRYIGSHELRLRAETGIDPMSYAVVMPRPLMDALERELFGEFTRGVETRLDDATPEEVRWLAMAARLNGQEMGALREHLAATGNVPQWLQQWLAGPTGAALQAMRSAELADALSCFSLVVRHGQLVLRLAVARPEVPVLAAAVRLFDTALAQARLSAQVPGP